MDFTPLINSLDHNSPLYYIAVVIYLIVQITPVIVAKKKNAKIEHLSNRSAFIFDKAKQIVVPIANQVGLANADRREKAVDVLYTFLKSKKINVNRKDLYAVTEAAYQHVKNNGGLNDQQPKQTPAPEDLTAEELEALTPRTK